MYQVMDDGNLGTMWIDPWFIMSQMYILICLKQNNYVPFEKFFFFIYIEIFSKVGDYLVVSIVNEYTHSFVNKFTNVSLLT